MIRSISCNLQLADFNQMRVKNMVIKHRNGRLNIIFFLNSSERDFHSRKCSSFMTSFDLSGLAQSPQHDKQITVIRLRSSGTFARTLILRKPLAFIGKTLKKYVKNSLKYCTFVETHFNYIFIQIKNN